MAVIVDTVQQQLQSFFSARKNFYEFLYFLFLEPSASSNFLEVGAASNLDELEKIHEGGALLQTFFNWLTEDELAAEQEEYQRLFIGPGSLAVPPWESFYRSKEQLLFEDCCYQVRTDYHRYGLQFYKENNEPDDHLLLELEFMMFLTDKSIQEQNIEKLMALLTDQVNFLENHLLEWVPLFCKRLAVSTNSKLYTGAALLLEDFLRDDMHSLKEIKEAMENV